MKRFLRIILAAAIIVTSIASVMGVAVFAEVTETDAVASIGTTYYESLDAAIDAAQEGDVIVLLKDMTATSKTIDGKKITIKSEGATKPVITAGTGKGAFWIKGESDVTFENIAFKNFESKNVIIYGTQDAPDSNTYKITVDNCEFEFSASGAIYGYNCKQAEIKVTNSSFTSLTGSSAHSVLMPSNAPAIATYIEFENNTLIGCGQEMNKSAAGTYMRKEDLEVGDETYDDTTAVAAGAVARIGDVASGKLNEVYFKDLALAAQLAEDGATIYILSDIQNFGGASYSVKTLKFVGLNQKFKIKPSSSAKSAFTILSGAGIVVENLSFEGYTSKNVIVFSVANGGGSYSITVKNTDMEFRASGAIYGYNCSDATINIENSSFTAGANGNGVLNFTKAGCYGACTLNLKDITLNDKCGVLGENAAETVVNETYTTDAMAKQNGIRIRVGATEGGKVGEVYFRAIDAATLKSLAAGAKVTVFCTCGAQQETLASELTCQTEITCSACNEKLTGLASHAYTEATCLAKSKCEWCQRETGEEGSHKYAAATCTVRSKCTVCGDEKGNLRVHKDKNADGKCDVCDLNINGDNSATTGSVNSNKNNTTTTAADDNKTEKKKGCGSTVTFAGLALVATLGSCAIFVEKKRG